MALKKHRGVLIVKAGGLYEVYLPKDKGRLSYRTDSIADAKAFVNSRKNPRRLPGYGALKDQRRKQLRKSASYIAGKRSTGRKTHKYFREGLSKAIRNPVTMVGTKAALKKYAAAHGLKIKSIRKVKRAR